MMAKKPWTPLVLSDLPDCNFIACDPSLTALGLVWLRVRNGRVVIHGAEKLSTAPTERQGWDDTFYRAGLMEALLSALVDAWSDNPLITGAVGVHEAPPAGGGITMRPEAATLTGFAFRMVMSEYDIPLARTVTPQSHKKLISGNHIAKKPEHHAAVKKLLPEIEGHELITNEALRDALSIGLYAAHRQGEED